MNFFKNLFGKSGQNSSEPSKAASNSDEPKSSSQIKSENANSQDSENNSNQSPVNQSPTMEETKKQENGGNENVQTPNGENTNAKPKAHIHNLIIVDESGSMHHLRYSTLSGVNETINTIKSAQEQFADTQTHTLTLVTFDTGDPRGDVRILIDDKPIAEVEEFMDYSPNGCTPLYDAMGQSLTKLHARIKDDEDATGVVTVLTDGLENASREWSAKSLGKLIEQLKEEGWTFSYMGSAHDVKSVTDLLNIDNIVEFSHDNLGMSSTWDRENSSRMGLYEKMQCCYSMMSPNVSRQEKMARKREFSRSYYNGRVTPGHITRLNPDEIFVFGSNAQGQHAGGAARQAFEHFGAVMGQGEGLQGQSYAIPTMEGIDSLHAAVERFIVFACQHPEMKFLVTRIGCGIAGYDDKDIAPFFQNCVKMQNVALPLSFWEVLGLKM